MRIYGFGQNQSGFEDGEIAKWGYGKSHKIILVCILITGWSGNLIKKEGVWSGNVVEGTDSPPERGSSRRTKTLLGLFGKEKVENWVCWDKEKIGFFFSSILIQTDPIRNFLPRVLMRMKRDRILQFRNCSSFSFLVDMLLLQ